MKNTADLNDKTLFRSRLVDCERREVYTTEFWLFAIQLSTVDQDDFSRVYLESTKNMKIEIALD